MEKYILLRNKVILGSLLAAVVFLGLFIWSPFSESATIRYEVKVTVTYDDKDFTGSKVWQLQAWAPKLLVDQVNLNSTVRGEAIPIDVEGFGTVYFLKRGADSIPGLAYGNFPLKCDLPDLGPTVFDTIQALSQFKGPCEVNWITPLIVKATAKNSDIVLVSDRWSSDPACADVCVKSVIVSRTSAPVTQGLLDQLPWLRVSADPFDIAGTTEPSATISVGQPPYYRVDFSSIF